ncbi:MAG: hypothetical protein J5961_06400 [Mogibacterium sp.]|nr:hypothetical protein [Mogibacterium sp.]
MTDIAPELLEKVQQSFEAETAGLKEEIANGVKSYEEAYAYAIQVGEALSKSFGVNITPEVLPDGMMYYNIADKVVRPMLQAEYELTSAAAIQAQRSANQAAGIGIKPLAADFDEDRAQGIIDRVSSQPFEEVSWLLNEPVKSFSKNVVDQTLEKNVEFQGKSGLSPKIRRTANGETCEWCQAVAGTYEYPNVPKDVYRRHANCDCVVEYLDGGKIQDVHTKVIYKSQAERDAAIRERIARAQEPDFYTGANGKTIGKEYRKWIGRNQMQILLQRTESEEVHNYIRSDFRKTSFIGDGSTAAVREFEIATGLNCGRNGNSHAKKVEDLSRQINKLLLKDLPEGDKIFLQEMLNRLQGLM